MRACKRIFSVPVLTYLKVRCAPIPQYLRSQAITNRRVNAQAAPAMMAMTDEKLVSANRMASDIQGGGLGEARRWRRRSDDRGGCIPSSNCDDTESDA